MATIVYKDAVLLVEGRNLSAEMHDLGLTYACESLDKTTFGNDTRIKTGGLFTAQLSGTAFADFAALAPDLIYTLLGLNDKVVTVFPYGITVGTACGYAMKALGTTFDMGGTVGSLEELKFVFESRGIEA